MVRFFSALCILLCGGAFPGDLCGLYLKGKEEGTLLLSVVIVVGLPFFLYALCVVHFIFFSGETFL